MMEAMSSRSDLISCCQWTHDLYNLRRSGRAQISSNVMAVTTRHVEPGSQYLLRSLSLPCLYPESSKLPGMRVRGEMDVVGEVRPEHLCYGLKYQRVLEYLGTNTIFQDLYTGLYAPRCLRRTIEHT
jgi:hypothetical protein